MGTTDQHREHRSHDENCVICQDEMYEAMRSNPIASRVHDALIEQDALSYHGRSGERMMERSVALANVLTTLILDAVLPFVPDTVSPFAIQDAVRGIPLPTQET